MTEFRTRPGSESECVFITAGPMIKLCAGGEGDREGHVLRYESAPARNVSRYWSRLRTQ